MSDTSPRLRIGVDLGGTKIEAIVLGPGGDELLRERVQTPRDDYPGTVAAVADLVGHAETTVGATGTVGIGIPGTISPLTRRVKNANSTWLIGEALGDDLAAALGRPVRVDNDANCLAVSEATDGAGAGHRVVFAVILGTGTGAGIAIDGAAHVGPNAVGGEWGHNPLPWPVVGEVPPPCYCGRRGCIETWLSGPGFARSYQELGGEGDARAAFRLAAEGDPIATQAVEAYEQRLARALAHVVNVLDPDVIVLGGGMSNEGRLYDNVPPRLPEYVFGGECVTEIRRSAHGDSSGVRGAAWLWPATR